MVENVDNMVREQLRPIRSEIQRLDENLSGRIDGLEAKVDGLAVRARSTEGVLSGLGGDLRSIDERAEHIEAKLGIE